MTGRKSPKKGKTDISDEVGTPETGEAEDSVAAAEDIVADSDGLPGDDAASAETETHSETSDDAIVSGTEDSDELPASDEDRSAAPDMAPDPVLVEEPGPDEPRTDAEHTDEIAEAAAAETPAPETTDDDLIEAKEPEHPHDPAEPVADVLVAAAATGTRLQEPEDQYDDRHGDPHEEHHDEPHGRSMAWTLLGTLVGILVVAAGTIWAAPKLAPYLPASLAQYLAPVPADMSGEIAQLRDQIAAQAGAQEQIAALQSDLAALRAEVAKGTPEGASPASVRQAVDAGMGALRTEMATQIENIEGRVETQGGRIETLTDQFKAVDAALAQSRSSEAESVTSTTVTALQGRLAALEDRAETFAPRAALKDLDSKLGGLASKADLDQAIAAARTEITSEISAAVAAETAANSEAIGAAERAVRSAALRGSVAALSSQVRSGRPYRGALTEIESLSGTPAPEALAGPADNGLATASELARDLPEFARAAIDADLRAGASGEATERIGGWLRSQVSARPIKEREGSGAPEILSRVEARVRDGDLAAALAEAESLSPAALDALGAWHVRLAARVSAEAALSDYLAAAGAN